MCEPLDHLPDDSRRIAELESQVRILTDKASAAADKLADYEDELRQLKSSPPASDTAITTLKSASEPAPTDTTAPKSRFPALLTGPRKPSPSSTINNGNNDPSSLHALLANEQTLRQQAEHKLSLLNTEIEDLSVTLFQQANEMVASERKARAKLEERIEILERRDHDRRKRLERLERAVGRVERVREVLADGEGGGR